MAVEAGPNVSGTSSAGRHRARGESGATPGAEPPRADASQIWDDAKATLRAVAGEKQRSTAGDIAQFAQALREASRGIPEGGPVALMAAHSAETLDRFSETLRNSDLDSLLREVEQFARSRPAVFLGMTVVAGFLATRFLKSGAQEPGGTEEAAPLDYGIEHAPAARSEPESAQSGTVTGAPSPFPRDPRRT